MYNSAYVAGAVFGALLVGALCGLVPLILGLKRNKEGLAWGGFAACVAGGFAGGIIVAAIIAGIFAAIILTTSKNEAANRTEFANGSSSAASMTGSSNTSNSDFEAEVVFEAPSTSAKEVVVEVPAED